jgi:hypothetical protein
MKNIRNNENENTDVKLTKREIPVKVYDEGRFIGHITLTHIIHPNATSELYDNEEKLITLGESKDVKKQNCQE